VLVSLLLPAIVSAQRAARRTHCQNSLRQIAIALTNYHDLFETFPPGYIAGGIPASAPADQEQGPGFGWGCHLLEFLDQSTLSRGINFESDARDPANLAVGGNVLGIMICPEDDPPMTFVAECGVNLSLIASSSYVGMMGWGSLNLQSGAPPQPGMLYRNSSVRAYGVADGLSNTIAIGERVHAFRTDPRQRPIDAHSTWYAAIPGAFRPAGLPDHPQVNEGPASLVLGTAGQQVPVPCESRPNRTTHIGSFSSAHRGGFHVALGDSSVQFLSDAIDFETFRRLSAHSDREPIGEF
jgi:hypothetical protein